MEKLVSRIPPAPRVPRVEGVSRLAPTVPESLRPLGGPAPSDVQGASLPRWRSKQIARTRQIVHASGAVIAALLLGALIAWASR
jgi:hypothetical protein